MPDKRTIAVTITGDNRQLRRELRQATSEVKSFERAVGGVGNKMRNLRQRIRATGVIGRGGGAIRTAAGFAGIFGFQQMITEARDLDARLTDIGITGKLTRNQIRDLKDEMFNVSKATGISTMKVLDFVDAVTVQTGNTQAARDALKEIGDVAVATGTDMKDLGGVFVKLTTSMGLKANQARQAFNILREQETMGSFTLAAMSGQFGRITGAATALGKPAQGLRGVQALGGLTQIAARGFGMGQESQVAESVASFLRFLGQKQGNIEKVFGVKLTDKSGQFRDLPTIFEELGAAMAKDPAKVRKHAALLFGEAGVKTAQQLMAASMGPGGFRAAKGSYGAAAAFFTAGKKDVIGDQKRQREESAAHKFDKAMNDMRIQLQKVALDVLPELTKALPKFAEVLKFIINNSSLLFKLWLGAKGAMFFHRLMAPIGGGGVMGAGGRGGVIGAGYGVAGVGGFVGRTGVAAGAARAGALAPTMAGGTWLNPMMGGQYVQGFGRNKLTDAQMLRREQSLARRAGRGLATAGRAVASQAPGLLMMLPMVPFFKELGVKLGEGIEKRVPFIRDFRKSRQDVNNPMLKLITGLQGIELSKLRGRSAGMSVKSFFKTTAEGARLEKDIRQTLSETTYEGEDGGLELRVGEIKKKRGLKGLETLRDKFRAQALAIRQQAIAGGAKTEEEIQAAFPGLKMLEKAANTLDQAAARLISGKGIPFNLQVNLREGPGRRLDRNSTVTDADRSNAGDKAGIL